MAVFKKLGLDIELYKNTLFLTDEGVLVLNDLHLGYEKSMQHQVPAMRLRKDDTLKQLQDVLTHYGKRLNLVIINGDIKEEYGTINWDERDQVIALTKMLKKYVPHVVFIKGNHDTLLPKLFENLAVEYEEAYVFGPYFFTHGHKQYPVPKEVEYVFIGHDHPAISISDSIRKEKFKCYLFGTYKSKRLIVLPSFSTATIGQDIKEGNFLSPYVPDDIGMFEVIATENNEFFDFGKVKDI
jgi:hypothetical protein